MRIGGIVLAGGQSRRMGRPKAWLPVNAELMLPRVVRLLSEAVSPLVVVAAVGQEVPPLPDSVRLVRDGLPDRGPMEGLLAGLIALEGLADAAYLSSCDVPFLRPTFVERVISLLGINQIGVPQVGGYLHPLAAVYRSEVRLAVQRLLAENQLRMSSLFGGVPTRFIDESELTEVDPAFESLQNLNTPEEYEAALRQLRGGDSRNPQF